MQKVPKSFLETLQATDGRLSVRPCLGLGGYAVEREMHETDSSSLDQLMKIWQRYSRRKIKKDLAPKTAVAVARKKIEATERLRSAKDHKRILFFIPDTSPSTLTATLYTLKETDLWDKGDGFKGDVEKHGNRVSAEMEYQDEVADRRKQAQFRADMRDRAKEVWRWTQLRLSETTVG